MEIYRYPTELFREDFVAYPRLNERRSLFCESERHWNFGQVVTATWTYGISWAHRHRDYPRWICQECYEVLPSREVARAVETLNRIARERPAARAAGVLLPEDFAHYSPTDCTAGHPAPVSNFQSLIQAASNCPAKSKLSFAEHFKELLTMKPTLLSRVKGDWKKTLTAQVVKFARRKGAIEELSFVGCISPGPMSVHAAIIRSPEVQDGAN